MAWINTSDTGDHTREHRSRHLDRFGGRAAEAQGPCLHVVLREELWVVRNAHSERAIAAFVTQDQAIDRAQRIATKVGTGVIIHGADGQVRDTISPRYV